MFTYLYVYLLYILYLYTVFAQIITALTNPFYPLLGHFLKLSDLRFFTKNSWNVPQIEFPCLVLALKKYINITMHYWRVMLFYLLLDACHFLVTYTYRLVYKCFFLYKWRQAVTVLTSVTMAVRKNQIIPKPSKICFPYLWHRRPFCNMCQLR